VKGFTLYSLLFALCSLFFGFGFLPLPLLLLLLLLLLLPLPLLLLFPTAQKSVKSPFSRLREKVPNGRMRGASASAFASAIPSKLPNLPKTQALCFTLPSPAIIASAAQPRPPAQ